MNNESKSFKEETLCSKIFIITAISALILFTIIFILSIYYFGILGTFSILGIQYDSLLSLLLFVIFYFLLGLAGDIVIKIFMILISFLPVNNLANIVAKFLIKFLVNLSIVSILDFFMKSIHISTGSQIIVALIIAVIELSFENSLKKKS
ncbi:YrvL family regulatory protein [Metabacillus fastidiosus]|uniref:YrvL family regulatory protein n=1 Tax=Metabacillus fastidiosus TaxID=1458 RepID=UPI003D2DCEF3